MQESIKNVKELPDWFSLEKYEAAKDLDSVGWLEQLSVRNSLIIWLVDYFDDVEGGDNDLIIHSKESLDCLMEYLHDNPIVNIKKSDLKINALLSGGALASIKDKGPFAKYALGVQLMTFRNLYQVERGIVKEQRDYARKFFKQFDKSLSMFNGKLDYKYQDWIDEYIDAYTKEPDKYLNVRVDITLPDKVLTEQFEALLLKRKNVFSGTSFELDKKKGDDFGKWIKFGVLPYFDLRAWAACKGVKIPNRVMADAIFPAGVGGEEVVRKTTEPLTAKILNQNFIDRLASIVAFEQVEGK